MKTTEITDLTGQIPAAERTARVRLPRRERERQMVDVATEVFGKLGYHTTSMDQIAEEAGISKPMLYAYFDSKEGLYVACLQRAGNDLLAQMRDSFRDDRNAEQHLWDGFVAFFTFIREHENAWQLIRLDSFYESQVFSSKVDDIHNRLRELIQELGEIASRSTPGDPFADPDRRAAMAHAMLGAAEALGNWWAASDSGLSPEVPCNHLMNFFWLGFNDLAEGKVWTEASLNA